jgi:hypothetical protein
MDLRVYRQRRPLLGKMFFLAAWQTLRKLRTTIE